MNQNSNPNPNSEWWKSWLKPSNLIALAALIVGITGVTFFTANQGVKGDKNCTIKGVKQDSGDRASLNQSIECSEGGIIEDVEQK